MHTEQQKEIAKAAKIFYWGCAVVFALCALSMILLFSAGCATGGGVVVFGGGGKTNAVSSVNVATPGGSVVTAGDNSKIAASAKATEENKPSDFWRKVVLFGGISLAGAVVLYFMFSPTHLTLGGIARKVMTGGI